MSKPQQPIDWNAARKVADDSIAMGRLILEAVQAAQPQPKFARRSRESGQVVAAMVAEWFGLPLCELKSKGRNAEIAWARQVAMVLMREYTVMSGYDIESFFRRKHGVFGHSERAVKNRCETERRAGADIAELRSFIEGKLK
jgi:chromosomal replication initiation ATPase DnaA